MLSRNEKRQSALLALCLGMSLIAGCSPITGTNPLCYAFDVIRPSRQDTEETLRQVLVHNQTYDQVCGRLR